MKHVFSAFLVLLLNVYAVRAETCYELLLRESIIFVKRIPVSEWSSKKARETQDAELMAKIWIRDRKQGQETLQRYIDNKTQGCTEK